MSWLRDHDAFNPGNTFTDPPGQPLYSDSGMIKQVCEMESSRGSTIHCPDCGGPLNPIEGCAFCPVCGHSNCN
jgi:hypothetical protein